MGYPGTVAPILIRFGCHELDLRVQELRKDGVKIKLEGQPLQILALLLDRPGDLVTREEFRRQLWPGNTIVDFEHSINAAVKRLREALGDSADVPRFIETLPRRGYRFVHPVKRQIIEPRRQSAWRQLPRTWVLASAGILAVAILAAAVFGDAVRPPLARATLAVLPLKNLSGDSSQDYFADGMTDALITELGKLGRLQVLSYQTMSGYRQTSKPLPLIARELGVDTILEGAVLRSGNRVRITANLVQPQPERHLWAESYEFDPRDILAVQAQVAQDIAARIRGNARPRGVARITGPRRVDPETSEAYLLGRAYFYKTPTPTNLIRAKDYFEKAIARDPAYAPAYASLAQLYVQHPGPLSEHPGDGRRQARPWAEKALKLDDTLAEAHTALARVAQQEWDWAGAEREYRRAIELNPSYAVARIWYAIYLYAMQRSEEAALEARRAQQLDPVSALINTYAAATFFFADRVDEAMASWQKVLELDPSYSDASTLLARAYITQGKHEQAIAELQKAMMFNANEPQVLGALAFAYAQTGRRAEALALVDELLRIQAERGNIRLFGIIWAYAGLGDKEKAFAWLQRAYDERRDRMAWLAVDPFLEPLRSDSRFDELVRRMNFPAKTSLAITRR
jgi:TolB-like protein/DNA-binding winged helix-turn-helix (wHTH) protein/Tfp pilus assembly protein PilF